MADFLARLSARTLGFAAAVQPRPAAFFGAPLREADVPASQQPDEGSSVVSPATELPLVEQTTRRPDTPVDAGSARARPLSSVAPNTSRPAPPPAQAEQQYAEEPVARRRTPPQRAPAPLVRLTLPASAVAALAQPVSKDGAPVMPGLARVGASTPAAPTAMAPRPARIEAAFEPAQLLHPERLKPYMPMSAAAPQRASTDIIRITIGRVEVRSSAPAPPAPRQPLAPSGPSLDEYLKRGGTAR
ncbi:hypothetical protein ACVWYQ_006392 [Bradyrhizobium sp. USDA 3397]